MSRRGLVEVARGAIVGLVVFAFMTLVIGAAVISHNASERAAARAAEPKPSHTQSETPKPITSRPPLPSSEPHVIEKTVCTFAGQDRLSCASTYRGGGSETKIYPYPLPDDVYDELRYSLANGGWYSPEPGRERFLTPEELTTPEWNKPSSPYRKCPDGDQAPWATCSDLSVGEVYWSHMDGTRVVLPREWWDPALWQSQRQPSGEWAPKPRRCPGSQHWLPYVPSCEALAAVKW